MKIKQIKTEKDHEEALEAIEVLMDKDPDSDSEDGLKLDLLVALTKKYEDELYPAFLPDPVDAILFRMEQQDLKPVDLIPYIGSRSKVSEILSRKRNLTLNMIRSLEKGLGIPATSLLNETDEFRNLDSIAWNKFPLKEMKHRGYLDVDILNLDEIKAYFKKFFQPMGSLNGAVSMLKKTNYRSVRPIDKHALAVWTTISVKKAKKVKSSYQFKKGSVDLSFMREIARLSVQKDGPNLAQKALEKKGIALVIEPCFLKTYLDGAVIALNGESPIISLTLRHDRLDNFWFTLMHELAHISLHIDKDVGLFYDDLDKPDDGNQYELEADELAAEALVPQNKWEISPARLIPSVMAAKSLARETGVHVVVVAGKIRHEGDNYVYLNKLIQQESVRKYFPEVAW